MQNRYAGDIGDFSKLGILRVLQAAGLTIGVNWYLSPDESHNSDGRHVGYLNSEKYWECDKDLCLELKQIVTSGKREISALQSEKILSAVYFSDMLDFSDCSKRKRNEVRKEWHHRGLQHLKGLDVVCLDPDNGLLVPSAEGTRKENKYAKVEEVVDYYRQGSTVIYYQHKARKPDSFYSEQQKRLLKNPELIDASGLGLKFITTSQRYYFFLIQPEHKKIIENALHRMLATAWQEHFIPI